jgi:hypothetical protein
MVFRRPISMPLRAILLLCCCAILPLSAESLPELPASDRVLTEAEVKNFWVNTIRNRPVPAMPTRLYPEKQARWRSLIEERRNVMEAIRGGSYDTEARMACLDHNVEAWKLRGDPAQAWEAEKQLIRLREHLAKLDTLRAQKDAAEKVSAMASHVSALQAEIDSLRSQIYQNANRGN